MTAEVTIRVRESIIDPWGMPVGNPHDDPPVVLFMAKQYPTTKKRRNK